MQSMIYIQLKIIQYNQIATLQTEVNKFNTLSIKLRGQGSVYGTTTFGFTEFLKNNYKKFKIHVNSTSNINKYEIRAARVGESTAIDLSVDTFYTISDYKNDCFWVNVQSTGSGVNGYVDFTVTLAK